MDNREVALAFKRKLLIVNIRFCFFHRSTCVHSGNIIFVNFFFLQGTSKCCFTRRNSISKLSGTFVGNKIFIENCERNTVRSIKRSRNRS